MRLVVVGSGTAAPEPDRVCSAYWVETPGTRLLLDCGPGAVHHLARFRLPWSDLDHLVISHFHNDHIGDVPMLLFALMWGVETERDRPLHLWGPAGLRERIDRMAAAFGDHVSDPGFPMTVHELDPDSAVQLGDDLTLTCAPTPHTDASLAFRIEARSGACLGYTGDTGASDDVARFLAGVDLMIAECSLPDEEAMATHLTPSRIAAMARSARPRRLMPTHVYPKLARLDLTALLRGAGWDGETVRATDGLSLDL
jgi:ribonuclease BN (tRNA processing enzyme)